jgi:hypothetical protein
MKWRTLPASTGRLSAKLFITIRVFRGMATMSLGRFKRAVYAENLIRDA